MNNYEVVIGVEVHIELKTKTKCFSSGANTFAAPANSKVNPYDAGFPGLMPSVNEAVVVSAIKLAYALNMEIDSLLRFDRKNYFYPDLAKGYQITQYYYPIGKNGRLTINGEKQDFIVEFERLHIEEDTAKQIHQNNITLLDYNRAGIPLLELVTKPIFHDAEAVIAYLIALRRILIFLNISDAKMSEGSLRCDLNISLRPQGTTVLGTKVEIKNLNSLHNINLAINDEIKRQKQQLAKNEVIVSQTRRFDEKINKTVLMRDKTTILDYKYFPEPDIAPIQLESEWITAIINDLPPLPAQYQQKLQQKYQLSITAINFLLDNCALLPFFFAATNVLPTKTVINYLLGPVQAYLNANQIADIATTKLTIAHFINLLQLIYEQKVNDRQSKKILITIFNDDKNSPEQLLKLWNIKVIADESEIKSLITQLLVANQNIVLQYVNNPKRVNRFFMGQIMKMTKGQVNPQLAQKLLTTLLSDYSNMNE